MWKKQKIFILLFFFLLVKSDDAFKEEFERKLEDAHEILSLEVRPPEKQGSRMDPLHPDENQEKNERNTGAQCGKKDKDIVNYKKTKPKITAIDQSNIEGSTYVMTCTGYDDADAYK